MKSVSYIHKLAEEKGWDRTKFTAMCMLNNVSYETARRMYDGETNLNIRTLEKVAKVLEVDKINQLVEFVQE